MSQFGSGPRGPDFAGVHCLKLGVLESKRALNGSSLIGISTVALMLEALMCSEESFGE